MPPPCFNAFYLEFLLFLYLLQRSHGGPTLSPLLLFVVGVSPLLLSFLAIAGFVGEFPLKIPYSCLSATACYRN